MNPDYALIVVDSLKIIQEDIIHEEDVLLNFQIASDFRIPVIVVMNKLDLIEDQNKLELATYKLRTHIW
jgi:50S ribosomal subunit-associated GTPase HflX